MRQLAEETARLCGAEGTLEYHPLPQDDPRQRKPDIARAQRLLGWQPTIQLAEGLRRTIAYFNARAQPASDG
jgi:nucleoside-diphosphate-sugar epimerase